MRKAESIPETPPDAEHFRKVFTEKPGAYVDPSEAAFALATVHRNIDQRAARRLFAYMWPNGTPAHKVLALMDGPGSELPERIRPAVVELDPNKF